MPTEGPTAQGKEQLVGSYDWVFNTIKLNIKFTIEELRINGNTAFARTMSRGQVTVLANKVTAPEENREFFLLEKVGGEWKIARYMFNKSKPSHS
jgi:ketosteroid isomerase-like protein